MNLVTYRDFYLYEFWDPEIEARHKGEKKIYDFHEFLLHDILRNFKKEHIKNNNNNNTFLCVLRRMYSVHL